MAEVPADPIRIIERHGPHLSSMTGARLSTSVEPDRLVKTHCCFCGQQCGIQLKVRDNQVIGFEPWEEFPFNRGMLCPKGVKRYLQGSHPDRLTTALRRDTSSVSGFSPMPYPAAIAHVAGEIARIQQAYGPAAMAVLSGASLTTEKAYLLGKFARVCLRTPFIDYNGRLCMVSAGAANKKAFGIDRTTSPWSDMVGTEVIWVAGSNVAECSPITTNYIWQAREQGARIIVQDPRITPVARTCDLYLPVKPGRDAALFAGVLQVMIERDWLDHAFIRDQTAGFDAVAEYCRQWTLPRTAEVTGVPERALMQADFPLSSQWLLAPHHGSRTSSSQAFIDAVAARHVLITRSRHNAFGHPHPQVLERYRAAGVLVHDTALDGALHLRLGEHGAARALRREPRFWREK